MLDWIALTTEGQIDTIINSKGPALIFKHSTRCSVSSMAKRNFESDSNLLPPGVPVYFLDLIRFRTLSARIAHDLKIIHESPQLLLVENGVCVYHTSHEGIDAADISSKLKKLAGASN